MRTYILSLVNLSTGKQASFRCEAASFSDALEQAEKAHPGIFSALRSPNPEESKHAAFNR